MAIPHRMFGVCTLLLTTTLIGALPLAAAATSTELTQTASSQSGFNAQNIAAGDTVWFQSVIQWTGTSPKVLTHVHITGQTLTFVEPGGTTFTKNVPSSVVIYDPSATTATTVWNTSAFRWDTTVPASYSGDVFAGGYALLVGSTGLPGGTKVTWSATFQTSESCLSVNWKWSAAVYTSFTTSNGKIGVKPVDSNSLSSYANSDHAGTPENFKTYLTAGARGGGGSNFTGSYSGTVGIRQGSCP